MPGNDAPILVAVHSSRMGGAQLLGIAAVTRMATARPVHVAIPPGPLRERLPAGVVLTRPSPTMPINGRSPRRWLRQFARSCGVAVALARHIREHGIVAVHTNSSALLAPVIAARLARVPAIVYVRELPEDRLTEALIWILSRLADTVISESLAVDRTIPAGSARVVQVYDGIPIPAVPPRPRPPFSSPLRVALVAAINGDDRKGQDLAISAVADLARRGLDTELRLVGPVYAQSTADGLLRHAQQLGVAERLVFAGGTDDISGALGDCDVLLSCARSEPLGLTVIEALAREVPVVGTCVGGVGEIVHDGATGTLVPPERPDAIADAIAAVVADPEHAHEMARRGRADVAERFDERRCLDRLAEVIEDVIARHA